MWNSLVDGDLSNELLTAWIARQEELRALLATPAPESTCTR